MYGQLQSWQCARKYRGGWDTGPKGTFSGPLLPNSLLPRSCLSSRDSLSLWSEHSRFKGDTHDANGMLALQTGVAQDPKKNIQGQTGSPCSQAVIAACAWVIAKPRLIRTGQTDHRKQFALVQELVVCVKCDGSGTALQCSQ